MTQLEILKLARQGAKEKLSKAAHWYETASSEANIEAIRSALEIFDEIEKLIEAAEKE